MARPVDDQAEVERDHEFACLLGPTVRLTARPPDRLFRLVLESHAPGADFEEKHEPVSDIAREPLRFNDLEGVSESQHLLSFDPRTRCAED